MKRFLVSFSIDMIYEIVVEAESIEEANRTITDENFDMRTAICTGEESIGVNNVKEID